MVLLLHLAVLWALAVAQPLLDLLGRTPEFFVARGNTSGDALLVALAVTLIAPVVLWVCELLARALRPSLGLGLHLGFVGLLVTAICLPPTASMISERAMFAVPIALAAGIAAVTMYVRLPPIRMFLTVLAPVPILVLAGFLLVSPVSKLVLGGDDVRLGVTGAGVADAPVVMVVFDELPAASLMGADGKIDGRRFPAFARLASDGTWYRNATTVAQFTTEAVPAILTGNLPSADALPVAQDHPENLFTLLADTHDMHVVEPFTDLCPESACGRERREPTGERLHALASDLSAVFLHLLLPEDLTADLPEIDKTWEGFGGGDQGNEDREADGIPDVNRLDHGRLFERFIRGVRPWSSEQPQLHFLHTALPHAPWRRIPNGKTYGNSGEFYPGIEDKLWTENRHRVAQAFERHQLQVAYADRLLGRLLTRLRRTGIYERALVVVTADHGISFQPGESHRAASAQTLGEIAGVPLLIKRPRQQEGGVDNRPVRSVDILPTIAASLRLRPDWTLDGTSVTTGTFDRADVRIYHRGELELRQPLEGVMSRRNALVRAQSRLLRDRHGVESLLLRGPMPELLGDSVAALSVVPGADAQIDSEGSYASVSLDSPVLPIQITGSLGEEWVGRTLAVAVNGKVAVTTRAYRGDDGALFSSIVAPDVLRPGANAIALLAPTGEGSARLLADVAPKAWRLLRRGDAQRLGRSGGGGMPIVSGAVTGFLDYATVQEGLLQLRGWSARADRSAPAREVVAFTGGQFVGSVTPAEERGDVVAGFDGNEALRRSGFRVAVPVDLIDCEAPRPIRVLGVADGKVSELGLVGNVEETVSRSCSVRAPPSRTR